MLGWNFFWVASYYSLVGRDVKMWLLKLKEVILLRWPFLWVRSYTSYGFVHLILFVYKLRKSFLAKYVIGADRMQENVQCTCKQ